MSASIGNAAALSKLRVCTPDSASAAITSSTRLSRFRKLAFRVVLSRHGDFLEFS